MAAKPEDFIHYGEGGVGPIYLQYKGIFDMQDLYESIAEFFRRKKFKFYEIQNRLRRPGPFGAEIYFLFQAERKVEEYYMWEVRIEIETFDVHDIEVVMKDGTKKKMQKGRIWMQINHKVITDYEKVWEKSAFLAQLKSFYNKYIIKKSYEGLWWDELHYKIVVKLHSLIKERLKMISEASETHMAGIH